MLALQSVDLFLPFLYARVGSTLGQSEKLRDLQVSRIVGRDTRVGYARPGLMSHRVRSLRDPAREGISVNVIRRTTGS